MDNQVLLYSLLT